MALFTDTITVYNYVKSADGVDTWKKTIITGVQWRHNKSELSIADGVQTEKKVESITVDFAKNYKRETYVDFLEFEKLEDKTGYWTLNERDGMDIVVLGESDKEIGEGYKLSDLRKDFQYCGTVLSVSDNRNRSHLKHIKVVAK